MVIPVYPLVFRKGTDPRPGVPVVTAVLLADICQSLGFPEHIFVYASVNRTGMAEIGIETNLK